MFTFDPSQVLHQDRELYGTYEQIPCINWSKYLLKEFQNNKYKRKTIEI